MESSSEEESSEKTLPLYKFAWQYQSNGDPWDTTQTPEWTCYSSTISSSIEQAYKQHLKEIVIDTHYCVDLKEYIQQHIKYLDRQRPVRRRRYWCSSSVISTGDESQDTISRRERLTSFLGAPLHCSVSEDTAYYGSPFVHDWLLHFSEGKMNVKFDAIFLVLLNGLIKEGQVADPKAALEIEMKLRKIKEKTDGKSSNERITRLQVYCARLYTKDCYVYRVVNNALRENDRTKLFTLGPFCYLLFNHIGQRFKSKSSVHDHLRRIFHPNQTHSFNLYRGDCASDKAIEEYQQAAGDTSRYFKWLPFVSTSRNQKVAEDFARDVVYVIEIRSYSSNEDRFIDLATISDYEEEKEILLLPGVQFRVKKVEFNNKQGVYFVHIKISSSYISMLQ